MSLFDYSGFAVLKERGSLDYQIQLPQGRRIRVAGELVQDERWDVIGQMIQAITSNNIQMNDQEVKELFHPSTSKPASELGKDTIMEVTLMRKHTGLTIFSDELLEECRRDAIGRIHKVSKLPHNKGYHVKENLGFLCQDAWIDEQGDLRARGTLVEIADNHAKPIKR